MSADSPDPAELARLDEALAAVLPALETFNRFEGPDRAGRDRGQWAAELGEPLPQTGRGLAETLAILADPVIPNGLRIGAPGFAGWVTTAPTTAGAVASFAASIAGAQRHWVQAFNDIEVIALRWLRELLGLPADAHGIFVSGGAVANLVGLTAARQWAYERLGHDASGNGLAGAPTGRIYASAEVHHVVIKAAAILGFGRHGCVLVETGPDQRLDVDALRDRLAKDRADGFVPVAVVANAGTVNTGAVDPISQIADVADEFGAWLHVDGAYGLFGVLDPSVESLYDGLARARSWATDPHKWLAAPVGCGAAFVRDAELLARAFHDEPAAYIEGGWKQGEVSNPFDNAGHLMKDYGPELSAPSRGAGVWAVLSEIGAEGMRARVVRHNGYARHLAQRVAQDSRLELLAEPVLSICCFRYVRRGLSDASLDALNAELAAALRASTPYIPSTTRVRGRLALRPCYINPRTTLAYVDGLADAVATIGDSL